MGYSTDFEGQFNITPTLKPEHQTYLEMFAETRRMRRDAGLAEKLNDPVRIAAGLPIGHEGSYFVGGLGFTRQDKDASIVEYNYPPREQPGLWCKWVPTEECDAIVWNGGEKFYDYVEWMQYLLDHFLKLWGYKVNGEVCWVGEDNEDIGRIVISDNFLMKQIGYIQYVSVE